MLECCLFLKSDEQYLQGDELLDSPSPFEFPVKIFSEAIHGVCFINELVE